MVDFEDFADQLQQEVVTDMAESYFGDRKNLDDMISAFTTMVEEFRHMALKLSRASATLHHLLLDRETAKSFFIALDIVPSCIPFLMIRRVCSLIHCLLRFTGSGRYQKCVSGH